MRRVALLFRGVNVGGNAVLRMADLREFLSGLGFGRVETLGASGNAVADSALGPAEIERAIERASVTALGRELIVLVRDAGDLDALVAANPFPIETEQRPQHVLVLFGREPVAPDLPDRLRESYAGPERLVAIGRDLVIDFPEGVGRSKLDPAMRKLPFQPVATARNWNTVLKLRAALA